MLSRFMYAASEPPCPYCRGAELGSKKESAGKYGSIKGKGERQGHSVTMAYYFWYHSLHFDVLHA